MGKIKSKTEELQSAFNLPLKQADYLAAHLICKQSIPQIRTRLMQRLQITEIHLKTLEKIENKSEEQITTIKQLKMGINKYNDLIDFLNKNLI